MVRCKSLGPLKSFLWYAAQLSAASALSFLILRLLRVHSVRGSCNGWLLDGLGSGSPLSPSWVPQGSPWTAIMQWTDGCNTLPYWYGRQIFCLYSNSLGSVLNWVYRLWCHQHIQCVTVITMTEKEDDPLKGQYPKRKLGWHQALKCRLLPVVSHNIILISPKAKMGTVSTALNISNKFSTGFGIKWTCE